MRTRPLRAFAPSIVITLAACSSAARAPQPPHDPTPTSPHPGLESRDGLCEQLPDCTPPASEPRMNPCNPPPPTQPITCPADMIATAPPELAIAQDPDGSCHVDCDAAHCDAPGQMRVQCLPAGAPPPSYASNLVIPAQTSITGKGDGGKVYTETRKADLTCDMVDDGTPYTNVPCDAAIIPHVAAGVVPVMSSTRSQCFYGTYVVACPYEPYQLYH